MLPYAPVMELLAELVRREGSPAVLQAAGPAGPELGRLVPTLGTTDVPALDSARSPRLFQAVSALLQNLSFRRPLVVVIEDVHWADSATLELLALLAPELQRSTLLVVGTLRSEAIFQDRRRAQRADIGFNSLGARTGRIEDDLGILLALLFELR
jgi:predicted ATPase